MNAVGPTRRSLLRGLVAMGCASLVPPIVAIERKFRRGYEGYQHTTSEFVWSDFYDHLEVDGRPFEASWAQKRMLEMLNKPVVMLKCRQYQPLNSTLVAVRRT